MKETPAATDIASAAMDFACLIVAGGRSSRMGEDKITATVGADRVLDRVLAACAPAPVTVAGPPHLAAVLPAGGVLVREDPPFGGPVAGLRAAVAALPQGVPVVAVLAGDQPFVDAAALAELRAALTAEPGADAAAYVTDDGVLQFLCSVWRAPALRAQLASARDSMRSVYAGARVVQVPDQRAVSADIDTPEDLATARERITTAGEDAPHRHTH